MRKHDDSLAAARIACEACPFMRQVFYMVNKIEALPAQQKNVSLAGLFLCLNKTANPPDLQVWRVFYARSICSELQAAAAQQRSSVMKRTAIRCASLF